MSKICVVGVGESDCGSVPEQTALQLHQHAAAAAVAAAGLHKADIDGLFSCAPSSDHALELAEYLGLRPRYCDTTALGGAAWEVYVQHAAAAIRSGDCEVALLVYGSTARSDFARGRNRPRVPAANGSAQFETPFGLTLVGKHALAARRHMHEFGTTSRQLAAVAVAANQWAQLNPRAFRFGQPLTLEAALQSRMIADPLRASDCCIRTDGGGAVILTTAERARDLPGTPVFVLGTGVSQSHHQMAQGEDLTAFCARDAGAAAFQAAGVAPGDINVLCLDDSFTITVLLSLEALGFCRPGEAGSVAESGALARSGRLPLNPDGGALAANQPGMRGIFLLIEAVRQLRGECGPRQVANARLALCNGVGGPLSAAGTVILGT